MYPGLGPVATVLVQDGTLRPGDVVLAGPGFGRVRSLLNDRGEMIQSATASTPVVVSGLNELPAAGDKVYQVADNERARAIAEDRVNRQRHTQLAGRNQVTRDSLLDSMRAGETKTIHLIIKADVQGSIETLAKTVTDFNTEEVRVKVIHAAAGGINESDVDLAAATQANGDEVVIIGFNVVPDESARARADSSGTTLNPMMTTSSPLACVAAAKSTSLSLIPPAAAWITFTRTSSVLKSVTVLARVSIDPCTSALMMRWMVLVSPARMLSSRLSRVTWLRPASCVCRWRLTRSSAIARARSLSATW